MTDDLMDARLRAAGERWRAAHVTPAGTGSSEDGGDPAELATGGHPPIHRTRRWITLASAAVVVAALAAGGGWLLSSGGSSHPSADTAGLTGTVWRLSTYTAADMHDRPVDTATEIYFARDGSFVGDGECAVAGGRAVINGSTLSLSHVVVRDKSCTDQYTASLTPQALPVLRGPAKFLIDATSLRIERAGVGTLEFVPAAASTPPPTLDVPTLVGADWTLLPPPSTLPANGRLRQPARLHFADDGTFTGSDGCNTFRGNASYSAGLTIHRFTTTSQHRCSRYAEGIAASVDAMFSGRVRASAVGGFLTLTEPGEDTLTYQWRPADVAATDPEQLRGSTWRVATVAGEPAAAPDAFVQISKDGRLTVQDGCRTQTGTADVQHGTVLFDGIHGRRCAGHFGAQSVTLDSFLSGRQLWSVRDGSLTISGDQQGFGIVLTPAVAAPRVSLYRSWLLTGLTRTGGTTHPAPPMRFSFAADGRVSDHEAQTAKFSIAGSSMIFHGRWSGREVWAGGPTFHPNDGRFVFDSLLVDRVHWSIDGNELTLTKHGVGAMTFITQPTSALDGRWALVGFGRQAGHPTRLRAVEAETTLIIADGTVTVTGRCDVTGGGIRIASKRAVFYRIEYAGHSCPPPTPEQAAFESGFVSVFDALVPGTVDYRLDGDDLRFSKRGAGQLEFRRVR